MGLLHHFGRPPAAPVARITFYYLGLAAVLLLLLLAFPDWASRLPIAGGDFFEAAERRDLFEPVDVGRTSGVAGVETALSLLASMIGAFLLMLPVTWVYMATRQQRGFNQSVVQTILTLPIVVAGIVVIVQNSLALAFSLAGIVAGVRFRTTLRDTGDALHVFAAIGVGLAAGIGAVGIAAAVTLLFNYANLLLWRSDYGGGHPRVKRRRETPEDEFPQRMHALEIE